jgi:xanthine dehydrogenase FAD-binding subunit
MKASDAIAPSTLSDALKAKAGPNVVAVAGGTDILVKLHDSYPWPKLLVLDRVKSLHIIAARKDYIAIGPLMTFAEIVESDLLKAHAPQLVEAASLAGSVQIRNRATIGGNLANGSPAGDLIPPLYALGANLELSSSKTKRSVSIEEFFKGPGKTVLKSNELITSIMIPKESNHGFFLRLATRRALAISKVSAAASLKIDSDRIIQSARIALGAVAPTVIRAIRTEESLLGNELTPRLITDASFLVREEACPIDDIRSNADYRKEMVGVLLKRGLTRIMELHSHA